MEARKLSELNIVSPGFPLLEMITIPLSTFYLNIYLFSLNFLIIQPPVKVPPPPPGTAIIPTSIQEHGL